MKKQPFRLTLLCSICLSISVVASAQVVSIPDFNLRAVIANKLGKARGATITVADMQTLDALYAANENIRNLTGLETATNLRELGLEANLISDLSPISGLTNLTFLHLRNNSISNISPIARLTRLTFLHIGTNRISNISPLAGLIRLTALGAGHNNIMDISPLARLPNLARIGLHNNSISNISPLAGLTQLTELHLHNNSISDLSPLVSNTGLRGGDEVNVQGNPLNALSLNRHVPTLQSRGVTVEFDQIVVPSPTVSIPDTNLRKSVEQALRKAGAAIITADEMASLQVLDATNRNIYNLTGLEHATNLRELGLAANSISDISTVARLTNLTLLDLRDNLISNISPLTGLTNLTALGLGQNNITNISPLAGLTRLTALNLWDNSISDISPLARLTKLTALRLDNNFISNISPLARLTRLTELYLENNSISDLWPLVANTGLGNGDTVEVTGNPLSTVSFTTHLPTLRSRGVTVKFDQVQGVVPPPPQSVNIPDAKLRNAIEQVLGKARGATITVADMQTLAALNATSENIRNLTGLETATNLTELGLIDNNISDLSPLAGLTKLITLNLRDNFISDLRPLVANTGLGSGDWIDVRGNPLSHASINTHIPTLQSRRVTVEFDASPKTVNIPDTKLRNVIAQALRKAPGATITIVDMAQLTTLNGTNKNITNLTGLEYATNLVDLLLINTNITDISPLARLTKLHYLDLANNSISDISPLAKLTRLGYLNLADNSVSDISHVTELHQLSYLNLENNSISDISPIVENTKLRDGHEIYLNGNPLSALSINTHIPALQSRKVIVTFDQIVVRPVDVNRDGVVNIFDLVSVASQFGKQGQNLAADVNGDGTVNIFDLVVITSAFGDAAAAPSSQPQGALTAAEVQGWLTDARSLEIKYPVVKRGITVLEKLLIALTPTETKLLPNYPNPFNPETWIPYRLAEDAFVTLTIYDEAGQVVRTLDAGYQTAAVYESRSNAIYWDGRNQVGESVASGVYFYHLSAGNFSATRKMLILK